MRLRSSGLSQSVRRNWLQVAVAVVLLFGSGGLAAYAASAPPSSLVAVTPCRAVDTRAAGGPVNGLRDFSMISTNLTAQNGGSAAGNPTTCSIPATATAIAVNVTVTNTVNAGYVSVFPAGSVWPGSSTLNWTGSDQTDANGASIQVGSSASTGAGSISAKTSQSADLIIDITGYYTAAASGTGGAALPSGCTTGQYAKSAGSNAWACGAAGAGLATDGSGNLSIQTTWQPPTCSQSGTGQYVMGLGGQGWGCGNLPSPSTRGTGFVLGTATTCAVTSNSGGGGACSIDASCPTSAPYVLGVSFDGYTNVVGSPGAAAPVGSWAQSAGTTSTPGVWHVIALFEGTSTGTASAQAVCTA